MSAWIRIEENECGQFENFSAKENSKVGFLLLSPQLSYVLILFKIGIIGMHLMLMGII